MKTKYLKLKQKTGHPSKTISSVETFTDLVEKGINDAKKRNKK